MPNPLNLELAFRRVEDELTDQPRSGRAFVANPFELELIRMDHDAWIADLARRLETDSYVPGPVEISHAPKGGGLVRPAVRLGIADRTVYTAAVGACLRDIYSSVRWSQRRIDFAPRLNPRGLSKRRWILAPFDGWEAWRERSLRELDLARTAFVLSADIAGYFENVAIDLLRSDLARIGCPSDAVHLIVRCLRQWAPAGDRGVPQGVLASDVLAKLYLAGFDQRLKSDGYAHVRYVDDIRVFCRSRSEAQRALVLITELLRERGLTLQSAKTMIRPASGLRLEFEGAVPAIRELERSYINDARAAGMMQADPSLPISVIDDLVRRQARLTDHGLMHRAFERFVAEQDRPDPTMFHYILGRLGGLEDDFAVDYCARLLLDQPHETPSILKYFDRLPRRSNLEPSLVRVLRNRDLQMYPYQRYLVLDWLWRNCLTLRAPTLRVIRDLAFGSESPDYVRAKARALLGRSGAHADLERLASTFAQTSDPLERAQLLCCLGRLETSRRNALAKRVTRERPWVGRAARLVRDGAAG